MISEQNTSRFRIRKKRHKKGIAVQSDIHTPPEELAIEQEVVIAELSQPPARRCSKFVTRIVIACLIALFLLVIDSWSPSSECYRNGGCFNRQTLQCELGEQQICSTHSLVPWLATYFIAKSLLSGALKKPLEQMVKPAPGVAKKPHLSLPAQSQTNPPVIELNKLPKEKPIKKRRSFFRLRRR